MNEIVAITSFVLLAALVMAAARLGVWALFVLSTSFILLSNITVSIPVPVFGVQISWAIIIYSLVYFITDIISEHYGHRLAYRLAISNLLVQMILWGYVWSALLVTPSPDGELPFATMRGLFDTSARITVAALIAGLGPFIDITIFAWVRTRWNYWASKVQWPLARRALNSRSLTIVVRNKLSTFVGQTVNTILFFSIALAQSEMSVRSLFEIIASATVVKIAVAVADTPFLVLVDRFLRPSREAPGKPVAETA